ncbi:hypothetical protein BGW36DRAFT_309726 [Talaromyces proteolyticus]|uniref:AB hydrolase-1 domain-containing protein n=1 Tax=Talaromyces proteolyticus TaxID=1131652 RepID=A0AAD4KD79_9EURO|nr:uncharacterized protein BGW36DRAFT_309726 [Talaromyces proteolyticus]KAH8688866.1 hypothetical protein BGW36DRAFT_309726 [Talaromyces proteolyticus]
MVTSISPLYGYNAPSSTLSKQPLHVAGILTTVFGLDELPPETTEVVCLWLLHPRLDSQEDMAGVATTVVDYWNQKLKEKGSGRSRGLIAVAFDARNHGSRQVDEAANHAWRNGNERHAQDMFSVYMTTARDVSMLIDFLPGYIFPKGERTIATHFALGISLGGHAVWLCLLHEPRVTAGVVVVGAPDYVNVMTDRARLSKLSSWKRGDTPGAKFLGSEHFPKSLLDVVEKNDPAGFLLSQTEHYIKNGPVKVGKLPDPTPQDKERLLPLLNRHLKGKRILNLSGLADKLVPYRLSEPFLSWLKKAIAPGGWFGDGGVHLEDVGFEGVAHNFTPAMMEEVLRFVDDSMSALDEPKNVGTVREAKI